MRPIYLGSSRAIFDKYRVTFPPTWQGMNLVGWTFIRRLVLNISTDEYLMLKSMVLPICILTHCWDLVWPGCLCDHTLEVSMAFTAFFIIGLVFPWRKKQRRNWLYIVISLEKTICGHQCFRYVSDARPHGKKWVLSHSERMWLTYMKYVPIELGEAQTVEQVWEEYFADPLQWWDNRVYKVSLGLSLGLSVSSY